MARPRKLPSGMMLRGDTYYAAFRAGGRLVRKRLSSDFAAAREMLNDLRARADRADFGLMDNDCSLAELRAPYEKHCRLTLRPRTVTRYRQNLNAILGKLPVRKASQLSDSVINTYREERLKSVSPRTVNMEVNALATMLIWAVEARHIGSNPLERIKPLPTKGRERKQRRPLSVTEVQAILDTSPAYLKPCWRMFMTTGIRRGELSSLTFDDIDFDRAVVTIRAENAKGKREREIPLDAEMLATIRQLQSDAPFRRPGKGNTLKDQERIDAAFSKQHVFVTQAGTPWGHRLLRRFYAICRRVGIDDAHHGGAVDLHSLRVTFTTLSIEGGANPKEVQAILGHSTLDLTMNTYAKSTARGRRGVVNALPFAKAAEPEHAISMQNVPKMCASSESALQVVAG